MKNTSLLLSFLLPAVVAFGGEPLFHFGPSDDYVSADRDFERRAVVVQDDASVYVEETHFDGTAPLLRSSDNYRGPAIYGGYRFSSTTVRAGFVRQQVRNRAGDVADAIFLQSHHPSRWTGSALGLHGIFLFRQSDFRADLRTGRVAIDSLAVTWQSFFSGDERTPQARYVVQIDGRYYVSKTAFPITNSDTHQLTIKGNTRLAWAPYDPASDLDFDADNADYAPLPLVGVTAVGLYFEDDRWIGNDKSPAAYGLGIVSFTATGGPAR